ncbi:MAG: hypothetical protein WCJ64_00815 [Rhodospirillaceae bacterium]
MTGRLDQPRILLHGFGMFAVMFRHLIEIARKEAPEIEWSIILPTPHHYDLMHQVLDDTNILSLTDLQQRALPPLLDTSELAGYAGNIFHDIEAEKRHFRHRPAGEQLARAADIYRIYRAFFERIQPTHLLISQIETYEGKMLVALARELGIRTLTPTSGRIFGGTYFSPDAEETLPGNRVVTPELMAEARSLLQRFRTTGISASGLPETLDPCDPVLPDFRKGLPARALGFLRRTLSRPELFEIDTVRVGLLNNMPWLRDRIWAVRTRAAEGLYDLRRLVDLPPRFLYYPLQVTPESSINTPAPYFVDQLRAIDAIRFAMPSDHLLVVKEHPAAISIRPLSFMRAVRRRAGVVVAHYRTDSRTLIQRAACTLSVTGSATIEAFLLGKPSLTLGPNIISEFLGGVCAIDQLPLRIRQSIAAPPDDDAVIMAVAEILSVRYDFIYRPEQPGEPGLRICNLRRFLEAITNYIKRVQS